MSTIMQSTITRAAAEDLLYREAYLLDTLQLQEWLKLFTPDGIYWIPIDESQPLASQAAIVYDTPLRREERVHHLLEQVFPAQEPRSRTQHFISNIMLDTEADGVLVRSSQVIYEMRTGDFTQIGLGDLRPIVAAVEYKLREEEGNVKIQEKKVLLINRDTWQDNLTFIL